MQHGSVAVQHRSATSQCNIAVSAGIGMADESELTRARIASPSPGASLLAPQTHSSVPGNLNDAYECEGARGMDAFRYLGLKHVYDWRAVCPHSGTLACIHMLQLARD